jgi:hypothetical protein
MWPGLIEWARNSMLSMDPPLANLEDMAIPRCAANTDEAIALIRECHAACSPLKLNNREFETR